MFGRNPESRDFIIALSATCVIAGCFVAYAHWFAPGPQSGPHSAIDAARVDGGVAAQDAVSPPQVIATVYECSDDNGRVLSDQPCGDDAQVRHIEMPNLMRAQPHSNTSRPARYSRSTRNGAARAPIEQGAGRNEARCESIDEEIDYINARMRKGYTSREGERFRRRLHELSDRRWEANCRRR